MTLQFQVLPLLPGFEAYKDLDYWPLDCIASKLFRNGAGNTQAKKRAKARLQLKDKVNDEPGAEPGVEDQAEPEGDPNKATGASHTQPESQSRFDFGMLVTPDLPTTHSNVGACVVIKRDDVEDMTQGLGHMSFDPVREQGKHCATGCINAHTILL